MDDRMSTVYDLVASFQLRRRATSEAFHTGVRLATAGHVKVVVTGAESVQAEVRDPTPLAVELHVEQGALVGHCPCSPTEAGICRHQVAVAHAVWVDLRRQQSRSVRDEPDGPSSH